MLKFFGYGSDQENESDEPDFVLVKHNKRFIKVEFKKPGDIRNGNATVGDIRNTVAQAVNHSKDEIVIVFAGKKLKEDHTKLKAIKAKSGSKMLCIISKPPSETPAQPNRQQFKKPVLPTDPIERIDLILASTNKELLPLIDEFTANPPTTESALKERHHILSELILQRLLSLDEISTHENPEARKRRKEAVNEFHAYQTRVDGVLENAKN
ncbi:hypothetical protein V1514DRAFT_324660 [Lipomyces japonicus]|uniref:uncharacterized protein n=1 Tax=Lipomyces japonicus TaxID=56871 RepID=UPI0034CF7627